LARPTMLTILSELSLPELSLPTDPPSPSPSSSPSPFPFPFQTHHVYPPLQRPRGVVCSKSCDAFVVTHCQLTKQPVQLHLHHDCSGCQCLLSLMELFLVMMIASSLEAPSLLQQRSGACSTPPARKSSGVSASRLCARSRLLQPSISSLTARACKVMRCARGWCQRKARLSVYALAGCHQCFRFTT
jgi:hypothetical protein